jgi:hypothetical protein
VKASRVWRAAAEQRRAPGDTEEVALTVLRLASPPPRREPQGAVLRAVAAQIALGALVVVAVAIAGVLLLMLAFVAAPLASFVAAWFVWRTIRASRDPLGRLRARWGSCARVLDGTAIR